VGTGGADICSIAGGILQDKEGSSAKFVAVHKLATGDTLGGCCVVNYLPFLYPFSKH